MRRLYSHFNAVGKIASYLCGAAILLLALIVSADVLTRKFTSISLQNISEICGYIFAITMAWGFPIAFLQRRHIRIDTIYGMFPRRYAAFFDICAAILTFCVVSLLALHVIEVFATSWKLDARSLSTLGAPLWLPQLFWAAGFIFFVAASAFVVLYSIWAALRGEWDTVNRIAGLPSLDEEIAEESRSDLDKDISAQPSLKIGA